MNNVTKKNNPELYKELLNNHDNFDTDHIPKHGSGYIIVRSEYCGKKYECNTKWDYNNGIEWDDMQEWIEVEEFSNKCPCCGQLIKGKDNV
jgi:hypothetical protein